MYLSECAYTDPPAGLAAEYDFTVPAIQITGEPTIQLNKPSIDVSQFDDGIVTVNKASGYPKLYARVTWRYIDPNGEGILIVSTSFVDPEDGAAEIVEPQVNGTMDFCSIIITDTARPSTKAPSEVNRLATAMINRAG